MTAGHHYTFVAYQVDNYRLHPLFMMYIMTNAAKTFLIIIFTAFPMLSNPAFAMKAIVVIDELNFLKRNRGRGDTIHTTESR